MLDHFGFNKALGIRGCASLWGVDAHLVHFTSVLRYPVFTGDDFKDYSGHAPSPTKSAFLKNWVLQYFAKEVSALPRATFLPLGEAARSTCLELFRMRRDSIGSPSNRA